GSRILTNLWEGHGSIQGPVAIVGDIFRCTAVIYINVIMSGNSFQMVNRLLTFSRIVSSSSRDKNCTSSLGKQYRVALAIPNSSRVNLLANCIGCDPGFFILSANEGSWVSRDTSNSQNYSS